MKVVTQRGNTEKSMAGGVIISQIEAEVGMSEPDRANQRQARREAILAAHTTAKSIPEARREALNARFESASSNAQRQVEYKRR